MAVNRFVEVTDKEINEIKINLGQKNSKDLCKNTKTFIRLNCFMLKIFVLKIAEKFKIAVHN
jgi:hypothetical protein